jgi:hypothetical protein
MHLVSQNHPAQPKQGSFEGGDATYDDNKCWDSLCLLSPNMEYTPQWALNYFSKMSRIEALSRNQSA